MFSISNFLMLIIDISLMFAHFGIWACAVTYFIYNRKSGAYLLELLIYVCLLVGLIKLLTIINFEFVLSGHSAISIIFAIFASKINRWFVAPLILWLCFNTHGMVIKGYHSYLEILAGSIFGSVFFYIYYKIEGLSIHSKKIVKGIFLLVCFFIYLLTSPSINDYDSIKVFVVYCLSLLIYFTKSRLE
jgi:hypothetical protein